MDALIGILRDPFVLGLLQLLVGKLIKRWPALANVPNRLIPVFNFLLAVLVGVIGPGDANAGGLGDSLRGLGNILLQAAVQTLVVTGIHSSGKNFWQNVKESALKSVASGR